MRRPASRVIKILLTIPLAAGAALASVPGGGGGGTTVVPICRTAGF